VAATTPQGALPFDATPAIAEPAPPARDLLRERLSALDPDSLSPREAQGALYALRELLARE
jgi:hypothetical protein